MKEIKAIIRPDRLDEVMGALDGVEALPGVTISEVVGWGRQRAASATDVVRLGAHGFARKTKVEVVVDDEMAEAVVSTIVAAARIGGPGDGKVFVIDVVDAVRIRTGERGKGAL